MVPERARRDKRADALVTVPEERGGGEPSVIARLAAQQERRFVPRRRTLVARLTGWVMIAAIGVLVVLAAVEVKPW